MEINFIKRLLWRIITVIRYGAMFSKIGNHTTIFHPLQLDDVSSICVGNNVCIAEGAWLMGNGKGGITVSIGTGTTIGHYAHIIGLHSLTIEPDVLIADKVFISDCAHSYKNINLPIIKQNVIHLSPVVIGEGSWIGENVCICGASIGKHCVIGANSVVTSDIPDYCVAVGAPARIIKRYEFESNEWKKVNML